MCNEPIKLPVGQGNVLQRIVSVIDPPQSLSCPVEQFLVLDLTPCLHDALHSVHPLQLLNEGAISRERYMFTNVSCFSSVIKLK